MWAPEHRQAADRSGLRYPSDLTDAESAIEATGSLATDKNVVYSFFQIFTHHCLPTLAMGLPLDGL